MLRTILDGIAAREPKAQDESVQAQQEIVRLEGKRSRILEQRDDGLIRGRNAFGKSAPLIGNCTRRERLCLPSPPKSQTGKPSPEERIHSQSLYLYAKGAKRFRTGSASIAPFDTDSPRH
jgi:hypothetical protein